MHNRDKSSNLVGKITAMTVAAILSRSLLLWILCGVIALVQLFSLYQIWHLYEASKWPTADGLVDNFHSYPAKRAHYFGATVDYSFKVDGKKISGSQSQFYDYPWIVGYGADLRHYYEGAAIEALRAKYTLQSAHKIYYSPQDPKESYIDIDYNLWDLHNGVPSAACALSIFLVLSIMRIRQLASKN